ncbi:hypothetical protein G6F61_015096 [Rhizopus arrhizus]|nr:hypothetical protein G6F61_015096 [Rhizopus arrhizus]
MTSGNRGTGRPLNAASHGDTGVNAVASRLSMAMAAPARASAGCSSPRLRSSTPTRSAMVEERGCLLATAAGWVARSSTRRSDAASEDSVPV